MLGYSTGFAGSILDEFQRMRREMDQLFGDWGIPSEIRSPGTGTFPAVNVGASPAQVDVYVFASGVDPEGLEVSLQQNLLTISGERTTELPEGAQPYRRERFSGSFRRVITLPDDVDPEKVNATSRDGVLHVCVQRREAAKPQKIEIK